MVYLEDNRLWLMHYEWYYCDESGQVALLDSGGSNALPPGMTKTAFSILNLFFWILPPRCSLVEHGDKLSSWNSLYADMIREQAQAGLYFYDHENGEYGDSYQLLISPTKPLFVSELPELIQNLLPLPMDDSFEKTPYITDWYIFGGEKRVVPVLDETEKIADRAQTDSLWRQFFELLQITVNKHPKLNHYFTYIFHSTDRFSVLHFCPQCLEQHGCYVELDGGDYDEWNCDYCDYKASALQSDFNTISDQEKDDSHKALELALQLAMKKAKEG